MRRSLRYWLVLGVKLAGFVVVALCAWFVAHRTILRVELFSDHWPKALTSYLSLAVLVFALPGILAVLLLLIFRDQRFRCRVCGRRLRMPLESGSRSHPMTQTPRVVYICPYGHGKLVTESWISGDAPDQWTTYGDIWDELFSRR